MYTRCPTCLTCFRVTEQHLSIAAGQVRCGQCQLVFNAPEHAIDDLPISQLSSNEASQTEPLIENSVIENVAQDKTFTVNEKSLGAIETEDTGFEEVTNNNEELSNAEEPLTTIDDSDIDVITEHENQLSLNITHSDATPEMEDKTEEFDFELDFDLDMAKDTDDDIIELINEPIEKIKKDVASQVKVETIEELQSGKIKSNDKNNSVEVIEPTGIQTDEINEDIPLQLRDDLERIKKLTPRRTRPLLNLFFIILLIALSFTQLAYFRAFELTYALPSSIPLIKAFCEKIPCRYSGPIDTKHIQLLNRDVRVHPKEKNALLISASMINNAHFAQPYPNIKIRLSDISGNVIAERIFNTKTYLKKTNNPFLLMKSKVPVQIIFEVIDPGKDAVNFEFNFL